MSDVFKVQVLVIVEPDDGSYHAYCPDLKGIHVDGNTEEEALEICTEAINCYLQVMMKHGDPIPVGLIHKLSIWKFFKSLFLNRQHSYVRELSLAPA